MSWCPSEYPVMVKPVCEVIVPLAMMSVDDVIPMVRSSGFW